MKIKILLAVLLIFGAIGVAVATTDMKDVVFERLGIANTEGHAKGEHSEHSSGEHSSGEHSEHSSGEHASEHEGGEGHEGHEGGHEGHPQHKIVATTAIAKDVTMTQQYVCQIHSRRHIELKSLEGGYLEAVDVKEGQTVKKGDVLFTILPTLYKAQLKADLSEAQLAQVEYDNTRKLVEQGVVSDQELKMAKAKVSKALATVNKAKAELDFAKVKAPFDGIIDRIYEQEGSFIEEGEMLTTVSDNSLMWVYYNVPEARYLDFEEATKNGREVDSLDFKLKLANHKIFSEPGTFGTVESDFNNETGNIKFRADFPNPERLLRHGQTGNILVSQTVKDAIVIPQRATYEILADKYVYVINDEEVVKQRKINIQHENDDIFVIESGLKPGEKIVLEGVRQVRDGDKIVCVDKPAEEVLKNLKFHAE